MAQSKRRWSELLSVQRLGRRTRDTEIDYIRRPSERDYDRIVFSSAFRRLKDKTQVFPLSGNDYTRTRLTHSLEAASTGRSLGRLAQSELENRKLVQSDADLGGTVSAACLAHDIGNPPFGHSGEQAIQQWAKENETKLEKFRPDQKHDFLEFEGNAQALRVVARLQVRHRKGGLQLTHATVGAMMKYPCGSRIDGGDRDQSRVEQKKFGYFAEEASLIRPALGAMNLRENSPGAFSRHPLAFLVEAADDICYRIVDLEDSVDQHLIEMDEAEDALRPFARAIKGFRLRGKLRGMEKIRWLRAHAINGLIYACHRVFCDELDGIVDGDFNSSLVGASDLARNYAALQNLVSRAYSDDRVLKVEVAGFSAIGGILDAFAPALMTDSPTKEQEKLRRLFPVGYLQRPGKPPEDRGTAIAALTPYQRLIVVTDYVAGMTDSFAIQLFQNLAGIRLPD